MVTVSRFIANPILRPLKKNSWESEMSFNGCPIVTGDETHLLYRAMGKPKKLHGTTCQLSTIGQAVSSDRIHFTDRKQFIRPSEPWEQFGCEDPRVTYMEGQYYIFYTAIATWPPGPSGIKVAVATSPDLKKITQKHLLTPFNAKAMAMFPDRINGKITVILTANTDLPPAKIAIAQFDQISDMWNKIYWEQWYDNLDAHTIPLLKTRADHIEVGAPPIKTDQGWLLIYCYIKNYLSFTKSFGIEATLLDTDNPQKILGHTQRPLLYPEYDYERIGVIPDVIFPSGVLVHNNNLGIYYGATDTTTCLATCRLDDLMDELTHPTDDQE